MAELPILRELGLILAAAALFALLARRIRMPVIAAFLFAGIALGPVTGLVRVSESLDLISHTGIALLLFLVGLELSLEKIRDVGRTAVLAGVGQITLTMAGAMVVCLLLGFGVRDAVFLALAVTISSTVVAVKLLDQRHELDSVHGRIAVGILMVQDLVVILVLTLVAGLGGDGERTGVAAGLASAFVGTGALALVALLAARWILPRVFGWVAESHEALFVFSLCWCFAFVLGAELLHLSLEIGAFLAGVSLAQLPYNTELRRRVHPLVNFFIAVFFVTLGIQLDLSAAIADPITVVVLTVFVLVASPLIIMLIVARLGYSERTSFLSGLILAQVSEFSFVLAAAALAVGLIDERVLSLIGVTGIITIAASAYMALSGDALLRVVRSRGLLRFFGIVGGPEVGGPITLRDHVIVVGMNALGRRIVEALLARDETVLAVDTDPIKLAGLPAATLVGSTDHPGVLEEAALEHAKLVVSALRIEDSNRLLAWRCRAADVPVAIHAFDQAVTGDLEDLQVDYLITSKNEGVREIAAHLARAGVLG